MKRNVILQLPRSNKLQHEEAIHIRITDLLILERANETVIITYADSWNNDDEIVYVYIVCSACKVSNFGVIERPYEPRQSQ
jgi:hypothetical protein